MKFSGAVGHVGEPDFGLVYMRARYYDPALGRFISEDPGQDGTNWYVYCSNNPVNDVDASGKYGVRMQLSIQQYYMGVALVLGGAFIFGYGVGPKWKLARDGALCVAAGMAMMVSAFAGIDLGTGYEYFSKVGAWALGAILGSAAAMRKLDALPATGAMTAAIVTYEATLTAAYLAIGAPRGDTDKNGN